MERYAAALRRELRLAGRKFPDAEVSTVYLGGGTPSILPVDLMDSVLDTLRSVFSLQSGAEFTSEANPGTLTPEWLERVQRYGVNRLSMGVQAAQDELLRSLGRVHTFRQVEEAFQMAREMGIPRLSADLMFALPGQTLSDFRESLARTAALGAGHLSAYSLIVEDGTPLAQKAASGAVRIPDEDEAADFYQLGLQELSRLGYCQYEISNFARPGEECRHNVGYWRALTIGAGGQRPQHAARVGRRKKRRSRLRAHGECLPGGGLLPHDGRTGFRHGNMSAHQPEGGYVRGHDAGAPHESRRQRNGFSAAFRFFHPRNL